jgi:AhpD family alkylhydroperoxidase
MQTGSDYSKAGPGSVQAMYKIQKYVDASGLEHSLLDLIKTRVSQINGCAFCIDMHTKDARARQFRIDVRTALLIANLQSGSDHC